MLILYFMQQLNTSSCRGYTQYIKCSCTLSNSCLKDDEYDGDDVADDFDEDVEDDNIEELDQPDEEGDNIDILAPGQAGGGVPKSKRITTKYMTKYERARVLGTRALQIAMCAPVMVELDGETDPLQIAMKELKQRKIPIIIRRYLPDNSYEDWGIDELIIIDH
ncbi:hypothetical protein FQR65_LT02725 [Abscondita terminalis]|nr:hypothetical protein FQR65_LT02725 [Abscondita terminalis]